jgi:YD repeat-containing protein
VGGVARKTTSTYDAAGRLASSTDALNHTTQYQYDGAGRLIETLYADGTFSITTYDQTGRKIAATDQNGLTTRYQYDALGDLTGVTLPEVFDPTQNGEVHPQYGSIYDTHGNLASEHDPLAVMLEPGFWTRQTSYRYDAFGNKVAETLPLNQNETWSYNDLGQLKSSTDFVGNVIDYTYDALGRVQEKDEYAPGATSPSTIVTYTYDNPDANNDGGQYDTVTVNGALTTSYYDVNGNLVEIASPQGTIDYTYDPATGEKTGVSTANTDIEYGYDEEGRLTSVTTDKLDGTTLPTAQVTTYTYFLNNELHTTTFPNGTVATRGYDNFNRLTSIVTTLGTAGPVITPPP